MSRVGRQPVKLLDTKVFLSEGKVVIEKDGHRAEVETCGEVNLDLQDDHLLILPRDKNQTSHQGLVRALVSNAVKGLTAKFSVSLDVVGVGYKVEKKNDKLLLSLGYSHPLEFSLPSGIECNIEKLQKSIPQYQTTLIIKGFDREQVGQIAANLICLRKPDAYKGKGIRYSERPMILKPGKSGGKGGKK